MRIGILTSGGDAPGMNACVKSACEMACNLGYEVIAFRRGYKGILDMDYVQLDRDYVADIFNLGGSKIMTGRSAEFTKDAGVRLAVSNLQKLGIEALVVIGGNGTYRGANELAEYGVKVVAIPATVDNDVYSTDRSIGFDTAVNNAVDMIVNIQATMRANERVALIETMGRDGGDIALYSAIASESDIVVVPEDPKKDTTVVEMILDEIDRGNQSPIVILAEKQFDLEKLRQKVEKATNKECRAVILGYMQRGGGPNMADRTLAIKYGATAISNGKDAARGIPNPGPIDK
ncbi:MAG: ATP-dependent 6-phosphofructokinase [Clostridia bacterium]|nr:ATP-dependent 6-phosphofructokinase [Clostridia bacterium]